MASLSLVAADPELAEFHIAARDLPPIDPTSAELAAIEADAEHDLLDDQQAELLTMTVRAIGQLDLELANALDLRAAA